MEAPDYLGNPKSYTSIICRNDYNTWSAKKTEISPWIWIFLRKLTPVLSNIGNTRWQLVRSNPKTIVPRSIRRFTWFKLERQCSKVFTDAHCCRAEFDSQTFSCMQCFTRTWRLTKCKRIHWWSLLLAWWFQWIYWTSGCYPCFFFHA